MLVKLWLLKRKDEENEIAIEDLRPGTPHKIDYDPLILLFSYFLFYIAILISSSLSDFIVTNYFF